MRPGRIISFVLLSVSVVASGQENLLRWITPETFGSLEPSVRIDATRYCSRGVGGQDAEMGWTRYTTGVFAPLWSDDVNEISLTVGLDAWDMDGGAILPDTGESFPAHLWDVTVGGIYRRDLGEGRLLGASVSVGSPSDKPFASADEVSVNATGFYRLPAGENAAWLLLLNYSNTRDFLRHVPLPGVAWHWRPGRNLSLLAGVPFSSVRYRPEAMDKLELAASYMLLRTVRARISYRLLEDLEAYGGFEWSHERFLRHDRGDDDDRLFYYSKQVAGGLVWQLVDGVSLEGFGGYAFDRFWFEGEEYDDRDFNRVNVSDGAFAGLKMRLRL